MMLLIPENPAPVAPAVKQETVRKNPLGEQRDVAANAVPGPMEVI